MDTAWIEILTKLGAIPGLLAVMMWWTHKRLESAEDAQREREKNLSVRLSNLQDRFFEKYEVTISKNTESQLELAKQNQRLASSVDRMVRHCQHVNSAISAPDLGDG